MNYYECIWYESETEEKALTKDPEIKEFRTRQKAIDFYKAHKNDGNKFQWWVTKRDEDGEIIEDIIY